MNYFFLYNTSNGRCIYKDICQWIIFNSYTVNEAKKDIIQYFRECHSADIIFLFKINHTYFCYLGVFPLLLWSLCHCQPSILYCWSWELFGEPFLSSLSSLFICFWFFCECRRGESLFLLLSPTFLLFFSCLK